MKHGGAYKTGDCVRSIKAIANADGRVLYIAPPEGHKKSPCRSGSRQGQKQNKMYIYSIAKERAKVNAEG